jgi:hypothetical protein
MWSTAGGGEGRLGTAGGGAAEEQRAEQSMCQRRKKRGGGPRDLIRICKNLKDFTANRIFPLIQSSKEEMVKKEVVELFKSYNFALGLKFRNLKYATLFYTFALNSNLLKFLSLVM